MNQLKSVDPEIAEAISAERQRKEQRIELVASENIASAAILEAQGSIFTDKYAEGYSGKRWYSGCEYVDRVEKLAIERAKSLFGCDYVNVQPHSGSQANMAVYFAMLNMGDTVLAMDLACGGHLTHGHALNFSGKYFKIVPYGVSKKDERIDYDAVLSLAKKHRPKLVIAGASAYPRVIDFKKFREIANSCGAYFMVDMAHIAGLVAAEVHPSPVPYAEFVTATTHKTLRGPRGGMIFTKREFAERIDREVFPGIQGGPLVHAIAAKAVALKEASSPAFKEYQRQVVSNAAALAATLSESGWRIISGGTDNHLVLVDVSKSGLTGKEAAEALDKSGITLNKNLIPFDKRGPAVTSGIRLGTPTVTTRGMKEPEMVKIAGLIDKVISSRGDEKIIRQIKDEARILTGGFPLLK